MLVIMILIFVLSLTGLIWASFAKEIPLDRSITVITTVVNTLFGGIALFLKLKPEKSVEVSQDKKPAAARKPFRVAPSFKSGFVGGLIGGGLGGLVSGVSYYLSARHPVANLLPATWDHILWNFIFGCVCGAVFGFISEFFVLGIRHLLPIPILSDVIGGVLGGGLAGVILGFWAVTFFGNLNRAAADPLVLFAGGIFSAVSIVLGVLLYDHKERGTAVKRTLIVLLPVTLIVATIGLYVFTAAGINQKYFETGDDTGLLLKRGAILATLLGALWGLILGLTLALYRLVFKPEMSLEIS